MASIERTDGPYGLPSAGRRSIVPMDHWVDSHESDEGSPGSDLPGLPGLPDLHEVERVTLRGQEPAGQVGGRLSACAPRDPRPTDTDPMPAKAG